MKGLKQSWHGTRHRFDTFPAGSGQHCYSSEKRNTGLPKNLGTLELGVLERRGILGKDKNPDTVSGIVLLLRGMNPSIVLEGVHQQVEALNHGILPPDLWLVRKRQSKHKIDRLRIRSQRAFAR